MVLYSTDSAELLYQVNLHLDMYGSGFIFQDDHWHLDLERLMREGKLYEPKRIVWLPGKPQWCHENCARIWDEDRETTRIVTGYAYSGREWFRHTWLLNAKSGAVWETSYRFDKYFGYTLNPDESREFVIINDV